MGVELVLVAACLEVVTSGPCMLYVITEAGDSRKCHVGFLKEKFYKQSLFITQSGQIWPALPTCLR